MTRSMYSTWKIAFDSTWAGPSWISWARRERSDSWASTIRIWSSVGRPSATAMSRLESPRSRKSHVLSRLRSASSELGELRLVAAERVAEVGDFRSEGPDPIVLGAAPPPHRRPSPRGSPDPR